MARNGSNRARAAAARGRARGREAVAVATLAALHSPKIVARPILEGPLAGNVAVQRGRCNAGAAAARAHCSIPRKKVTLPSASLGLAVEVIWGWPFGLALREKSRGRGLQPKVEGRRPSTTEGAVEVKEEGRAEWGWGVRMD